MAEAQRFVQEFFRPLIFVQSNFKMTKVQEIKPSNFTDYIQIIETLNSIDDPIWFRGAGQASYKLTPGLYRHPKKTLADIAMLERDTMVRFRQRSIPFSDKSLQDDWDALFFMQHHGVPTRLLDWSESPFVAFYFAVMSAPYSRSKQGALKYSEDAAVWVLSPGVWNRFALSHQSFDGGVLVTKDPELSGYQPAPTFAKMNNHAVALYGAHNSPRIVAQRGVFTIFGQNLSAMDEAYDVAGFPVDSLKKIVLPKTILPALRNSILSYGITESVIYPDLNGLAAEIRRTFGFEV